MSISEVPKSDAPVVTPEEARAIIESKVALPNHITIWMNGKPLEITNYTLGEDEFHKLRAYLLASPPVAPRGEPSDAEVDRLLAALRDEIDYAVELIDAADREGDSLCDDLRAHLTGACMSDDGESDA